MRQRRDRSSRTVAGRIAVLAVAFLVAGCPGGGSFDLTTEGVTGPGANGTPVLGPATTAGDLSGGLFSVASPAGVASTQGNALSNAGTDQSAANGSDFSFEAVLNSTSFAPGQRQLSECFSSSAAAPWVFSSVSPPGTGTATLILDQNAAQAWAGGATCQNCVYGTFSNTYGVQTVNLPAGNFCLAGSNTGASASNIGAELRPLSDYNFPLYAFNGAALEVVKTLAAGATAAWPVVIRSGTHMILDGSNSGGGKTYLIAPSALAQFQQTNGGQNGGFPYLTATGGAVLCGTGPASVESAPEDCDNLDQLLTPGTYYYAIVNPTAAAVAFVAFAFEYTPQ